MKNKKICLLNLLINESSETDKDKRFYISVIGNRIIINQGIKGKKIIRKGTLLDCYYLRRSHKNGQWKT